MQILMTDAAHQRVRGRLATLAPDAQIVTVDGPDSFKLDGAPLEKDAVAPEIVWLSLDSISSGLVGAMAGRLLQSAEPARWMQGFMAGLDNPMFKNVMGRGTRITKSSAQAIPIAEYVVAHAVSLLGPISSQANLQREHKWGSTPYREIGASRWLLVGYGAIGQEIAKRIKPFGVDLTVVRRSPDSDALVDRTISQQELAAALPETDVVVLACSLNDDTRGMANEAFFKAMKPGAILVNIGRGALVDEDALKAGLDRDQPGHAVLDVFATEPLPADSWFWDHPKVRVSGHTSNSGDGVQGRGDELFIGNLQRYLAGQPLLNEAHPSEVGL